MLVTGNENTGENGMSSGTALGAVTTIGLASNDRRSKHALGQIVGGIHLIDVEETQEMRSISAQAFCKAGIVRIGEASRGGDQCIQARFEGTSTLREGARGQGRFLAFEDQGFLQQAGGLAGELQRSSGLGLVHLLEIFQQMAQAFLFEPVTQSAVVVGQEPIGGQDTCKVGSQDVEDHITAAVGTETNAQLVKILANYLITDTLAHLESGERALRIEHAAAFRALGVLVLEGHINSRVAKDLLLEVVFTGADAKALAEARGLMQRSNADELIPIIDGILAAHPTVVEEFKAGKEAVLQFLVGQGMKATKGSANPGLLAELIKSRIGS